MRKRAFTLIEIMVVVLIIGMLATVVGTHVWPSHDHALRRIALAKCSEYHGAVKMWCMVRGAANLPRTLMELEAPLDPGGERFLRVDPDPWGNDYRIVHEGGRRFRIWSNGPDGAEGTADDICFEPLDDD